MTYIQRISNLVDAKCAGGEEGHRCTLIITDGDAAKLLVVSGGLAVTGRDYYGVFSIRGKIMNVRDASKKSVIENEGLNSLINIIGLDVNKKYNNAENMRSLRYGKVMLMANQDPDGSHNKALLINLIHTLWPELIQEHFLEEFITPIIKATKGNDIHWMFSIPEFKEWKLSTDHWKTFNIKYYKGLSTFTVADITKYFVNIDRHRICFRYAGESDDAHLRLAFSRKCTEARKEWLTNFMMESKQRKQAGLAEKYLYKKETRHVSYTDFVNLELVRYSHADNVRSIPSFVDGLKPGQRKMHAKKAMTVTALAGSVAQLTDYQHGEVKLCSTIMNLAQNFVGTNNINLLKPIGEFGSRLAGGKDAGSPSYIYTKLSPLTRAIFHPDDDALLTNLYAGKQRIEPEWYIPIIPMVLVNGAEGIGTGWRTKIPKFNPRDLVAILREMLDGADGARQLMPYYKNFKGTIDDCGEGKYLTSGEIHTVGKSEVEITELPIGTWPEAYKETVLQPMLDGSQNIRPLLKAFSDFNTKDNIKYTATLQSKKQNLEENSDLHKKFKLQATVSATNMCAFDESNCLRKFESVQEVIQDFYELRLKMYERRKEYRQGALQAEHDKLSAQVRFVSENSRADIILKHTKQEALIVQELRRLGYLPDPVATWKASCNIIDDEEDSGGEEVDDDDDPPTHFSKDIKNLKDGEKFDYLLGQAMAMVTNERKEQLHLQLSITKAKLAKLKKQSHIDIWKEDLDNFIVKLDEVEDKERLARDKNNYYPEPLSSATDKRMAAVVEEDNAFGDNNDAVVGQGHPAIIADEQAAAAAQPTREQHSRRVKKTSPYKK